MANSNLRPRGRAAATAIKAFGGCLAGCIMIYLGISGKIIPAGGLPASAAWGRSLGDTGVRGVAIGLGAVALVACAWWMCGAIRAIAGASRD